MKSYLSFKIGKEYFALDIANVLEIIMVPQITPLPNSAEHIVGVVNNRGNVLLIIDPYVKFGFQNAQDRKEAKYIIVMELIQDERSEKIGVLIDHAENVLEIDESQILPPPGQGSEFKEDIISGIIKMNNHFIMILKPEPFVNNDNLKI